MTNNVDTATRQDKPNVWFLWLWAVVFSPVVLILAPLQASKARQRGYPVTPYWIPFGVVAVLWVIILLS